MNNFASHLPLGDMLVALPVLPWCVSRSIDICRDELGRARRCRCKYSRNATAEAKTTPTNKEAYRRSSLKDVIARFSERM